VHLVIRECQASAWVLDVCFSPDIPVIADAVMKVITQIQQCLAWRHSLDYDRLKTRVITEAVRNARETGARARDEAGGQAGCIVNCVRDVLNVICCVHGRNGSAGPIGSMTSQQSRRGLYRRAA